MSLPFIPLSQDEDSFRAIRCFDTCISAKVKQISGSKADGIQTLTEASSPSLRGEVATGLNALPASRRKDGKLDGFISVCRMAGLVGLTTTTALIGIDETSFRHPNCTTSSPNC